jgi:hypothetical protein
MKIQFFYLKKTENDFMIFGSLNIFLIIWY